MPSSHEVEHGMFCARARFTPDSIGATDVLRHAVVMIHVEKPRFFYRHFDAAQLLVDFNITTIAREYPHLADVCTEAQILRLTHVMHNKDLEVIQ